MRTCWHSRAMTGLRGSSAARACRFGVWGKSHVAWAMAAVTCEAVRCCLPASATASAPQQPCSAVLQTPNIPDIATTQPDQGVAPELPRWLLHQSATSLNCVWTLKPRLQMQVRSSHFQAPRSYARPGPQLQSNPKLHLRLPSSAPALETCQTMTGMPGEAGLIFPLILGAGSGSGVAAELHAQPLQETCSTNGEARDEMLIGSCSWCASLHQDAPMRWFCSCSGGVCLPRGLRLQAEIAP